MDGITWPFLSYHHDNNIDSFTEISIYSLVLGAASQYLGGFWESKSQNCDIILAVTVMSSDALPLWNMT